jgi:prophage antirepressor-like protein
MINRTPTAMDTLTPMFTTTPDHTPSLFHFNDNVIRTDVDHQGSPWFVAADVCAALGIKNNRDALATLDPDEKGVAITDTLRGLQSFATVNEAGLYELIFRSRKPEAKDFKRWVKQTVLPAIRKDGMYAQGEENLFAGCVTDGDYDKAIEVAEAHVAGLFKAKALQKKAEHQAEKDARYTALKMLSRGRTRRRKGPKQLSR